MYCCRPAGSPPPLSGSPSLRPTAPAQNSDSTAAFSCVAGSLPTSPVLARCQLMCKRIFQESTPGPAPGSELVVPGSIFLHFSGEATQAKTNAQDSALTLESSSCVRSSSSSPFLALLSVVWLSSSLFTERGSRSDDVVPAASFRSGDEEVREV